MQNSTPSKLTARHLAIPAGNALALAAALWLGSKGIVVILLMALAYQLVLPNRLAVWAQCTLYLTVTAPLLMGVMLEGGNPWTVMAIIFSFILGLRLAQKWRTGAHRNLLRRPLPSVAP